MAGSWGRKEMKMAEYSVYIGAVYVPRSSNRWQTKAILYIAVIGQGGCALCTNHTPPSAKRDITKAHLMQHGMV